MIAFLDFDGALHLFAERHTQRIGAFKVSKTD